MTYCDFVDFQLIVLSHELEADSASETGKRDDETVMYFVVSETVFMFIRKVGFLAILKAVLTKLSRLTCRARAPLEMQEK
jgi:hypothetical protein